MLSWFVRLIHLALLRMVSKKEAEVEVLRWAKSLEESDWHRTSLDVRQHPSDWASDLRAGGNQGTLAKKVVTAISEWETMPYEMGDAHDMTQKQNLDEDVDDPGTRWVPARPNSARKKDDR